MPEFRLFLEHIFQTFMPAALASVIFFCSPHLFKLHIFADLFDSIIPVNVFLMCVIICHSAAFNFHISRGRITHIFQRFVFGAPHKPNSHCGPTRLLFSSDTYLF